MNSGVCIKGSNYSADESDFYVRLLEVVELEYPRLPIKRVVLFKCEWFDPTPNSGMKIHKQYKLADVNHTRKLTRYEPFVMAAQATQVYYASYPSLKRDKRDWWDVCKIKARHAVDIPNPESRVTTSVSQVEPFQHDELNIHPIEVEVDVEHGLLNDPNGSYIDIYGEEGEEDSEIEGDIHLDDDFNQDEDPEFVDSD